MQIYLVGGAVRDALLGLPVKERDWVVVGAVPADLVRLGYRNVGRDFPVFLHPETHEEYALARVERKTAPGYHGFETRFSPDVTLEEDLRRRDLTVNAMARDADGALIDPYGGRADLERRVLRHVSDAFAEDPVRILRVARFAARYAPLGFNVAPETLALMRQMVGNGEAGALVPERVWQETAKALAEPAPQAFISVLRAAGALAVVFPELDRLWGVPQPARWHPEIDTGTHMLLVLEAAAALSPIARVRFAALTHDLGKGETPPAEWPKHVGHEARSVALVHALADRLRVPNDFRELAVLVARYHGVCHRALELRPATVLELLENCDAPRRPERFAEFLLACEADMRGRTGFADLRYPEGTFLRDALAVVRATTLPEAARAGLTGAAVGERLRATRIAALGPVCASRTPIVRP
ncbi:MAG TPA: multifunctional CCA addition/repair protein [Steroidobacteraceae bacterium]|nr:multifunctional CCA addition/repair protein [Steroidobacteraceae bacterium]